MRSQHEIDIGSLQRTVEALEKDKIDLQHSLDDEKKKVEDLLFAFEEESISKSEIQVIARLNGVEVTNWL